MVLGAHRVDLLGGDQPLEHVERLRPGAILDERVEALVQEAMILGRKLERLGPGADGALRVAQARRVQVADLVEQAHLLVGRRGDRQRALGVDERLRISSDSSVCKSSAGR